MGHPTRGLARAAARASVGDLTCDRHPDAAFVVYVDDSPWVAPRPREHWACSQCLDSFRAFCREINVRPKDRPLFHGLRAS